MVQTKAIKLNVLLIVMVLASIFGWLARTGYDTVSTSEALYRLSLYCDVIPVEVANGKTDLILYVHMDSDKDFYKYVYIVDKRYNNIKIEYSDHLLRP